MLAVSAATDTIYAPNSGSSFSGDTMSVINGATCNGTSHSGCSHLAATVTVGSGPFGVTVDDRTHTVYVANNADGDSPGTVSVINGATCNGTDTAGCTGHFPTMATGRSPLLAAVDTSTGIVYVTDFSSAGVSILDGSRCNASLTSGCGAPPREQAVGSQPFRPGHQPEHQHRLCDRHLPGRVHVHPQHHPPLTGGAPAPPEPPCAVRTDPQRPARL